MANGLTIPQDPSRPVEQPDDSVVAPEFVAEQERMAAEEAHSALISEASEFLSTDDIEALKTPEQIKTAIGIARRVRAATEAEFIPAPDVDADAAREGQGSDGDEIEIPPEDDQVDPAAWKAVKALNDRIKALKAEVPSKSVNTHDFLFAGTVKDIPDLGKGPTDALPTNSKSRQLRTRIVAEAGRIQDEARKGGTAVPGFEESYRLALRSVCGAKVQEIEQNAKAAAAKAREEQLASRPGAQRRIVPFGPERAKMALDAQRRARGETV